MSMTDPQLRLLLLRRLPATETARLEEAILLEEGFAERLCNEEFDLLDDYAASRLNAEDAADVERYLLTSGESRRSLRVARALHAVASSTHAPRGAMAASASASSVARRRRTPRFWGLAALLAACLAVVAYLPQWRPASPIESGQSSGGQSRAPAIALMADVNRGARPVLSVPSGAASIRLQAEVPEPSTGARYSLSIQDAVGRQLFAAAGLEVRTVGRYQFVETVVPPAALAPGDRTVVLKDSGAARDAQARFTWQVTGALE